MTIAACPCYHSPHWTYSTTSVSQFVLGTEFPFPCDAELPKICSVSHQLHTQITLGGTQTYRTQAEEPPTETPPNMLPVDSSLAKDVMWSLWSGSTVCGPTKAGSLAGKRSVRSNDRRLADMQPRECDGCLVFRPVSRSRMNARPKVSARILA